MPTLTEKSLSAAFLDLAEQNLRYQSRIVNILLSSGYNSLFASLDSAEQVLNLQPVCPPVRSGLNFVGLVRKMATDAARQNVGLAYAY